jgi:serine O-acetyltransferase
MGDYKSMFYEWFRLLSGDLGTFSEFSRSKLYLLLTTQGAWAMFTYRFGHLSYLRYQKNKFYIVNMVIWYILNKIVEITAGISIHYKASIGERFMISHFGNIIIDAGTKIGDDCSIRQGVTMGNGSLKRSPVLGNNVYIGTIAVLIGGITIGDHSKIGALAMVNKSFPENSIIVGVPAVNKRKY